MLHAWQLYPRKITASDPGQSTTACHQPPPDDSSMAIFIGPLKASRHHGNPEGFRRVFIHTPSQHALLQGPFEVGGRVISALHESYSSTRAAQLLHNTFGTNDFTKATRNREAEAMESNEIAKQKALAKAKPRGDGRYLSEAGDRGKQGED
ncbi:hypothetical protein MHYP_G00043470 [Metynnis hypsauchen]